MAPDGVLVRVRAASLNPVDYKVREGALAGAFPFHFPVILGWDAAGVVEEVGPAVTWFRPGDAVYGYCRRHELEYGTYAEFTTVPEGFLAHMPEELSFEEAAALPLAALVAHQSLELLGLRGGEHLFLTGGAGGVGHIAIQLALARGARVIATASPANHDFLRELGRRAARLPRRERARSSSASSPTAAAPTPPSTSSAATARSRPSPRCASAAASSRSRRRPRSASTSRPATSSSAPPATTSASTSPRSSTTAACAPTSPPPSRWRTRPRPTSASKRATCAASSS